MHNQKRNKLLSAKTRLPPWLGLPDHIDFTDKITKKTHSAPEYTRGPRQGDIFFFNFEDEAIWLICKVSLLPAFEVFLELR